MSVVASRLVLICVDDVDGDNDVNCDQSNCNDGASHHQMITPYVFVLYCFHYGARIVLSIYFDFYFRFVFTCQHKNSIYFIAVSLSIAGWLIKQLMIGKQNTLEIILEFWNICDLDCKSNKITLEMKENSGNNW